MDNWISWDDLTPDEKEMATETYISIREHEEGRHRSETNNDYPEPIDPTGVECCSFARLPSGALDVLI